MSRRTTHFARAFTLLELILVLALIAVVVSIAMPLFTTFASSQGVGDSADRVLALARWARSQSISQGVNFRLNFDPNKHAIWLTMQNGVSFENVLQDAQQGSLGLSGGSGNSQTTTQFGDVGESIGARYVTPDGITINCPSLLPQPDGTYFVQFRPTGRSDPGTIEIHDAKGQVVVVGCLTGAEQFHLLSDDEKQMAPNMNPLAPAPQSR